MPRTEIDDIFSSKTKPTPAESTPLSAKVKGKAKAIVTPSVDASAVEKKRKKKKKKTKDNATEVSQAVESDDDTPAAAASTAKRKRAEPETVLDPSLPAAPSKKLKAAPIPRAEDASSGSGKPRKTNIEAEQRFRDSRGTGPRKKTDEGFSIYKEDELGIGDEGGDTPLCPFDCDCCF